jgi:hypothetical protein
LKKKFVAVVVLEHPTFAALSSVVDQKEFDTIEGARQHSSNLLEVYRGDQYALISMASPFILDDYVRVLATERMESGYY